MKESLFGDLSVIGMRGCEQFVSQVDYYLKDWRRHGGDESFTVEAECPRFGTGEAKGLIHKSLRGHDVYVICDPFNYGVTYSMYGQTVPMSPDDHLAELKRMLGAMGGKGRRTSVILRVLHGGRQHRRTSRESLDCALMLRELENMGVSNIITFDAHDARIQNAIPLCGFDSVRPTYQMLKAFVRNVPDAMLDKDNLTMISPDEGAMSRCMYYSSVLGIDIGMFYKRRDYTRIVNGKNPITAHEYLGSDLNGKDVIIVDDMISSGDSILDVSAQLKEKGAKRIFTFATFGLFTDGVDKFTKAYEEHLIDKVFTTNLVYRRPELFSCDWYVEVNMCKYVAYIIDTLNHDESISELLNPVKRINNLLEKHRAATAQQIKISFDN